MKLNYDYNKWKIYNIKKIFSKEGFISYNKHISMINEIIRNINKEFKEYPGEELNEIK